ncbi:MAG: ribonuclease T [Alphaproteobacteria bacterium]|nr:ribonuclease T [Alphaproteobacteria bacterium]
MKFDRRTIVRLGAAVVVAIVLGLARLLSGAFDSGGEPTSSPRDASTAAVAQEQPNSSGVASEAASARASADALPVSQGDFDYYVLVLSWSPTHCASDAGRGPDDDMQCRSGRPYGFVLHGLWPQNERGYPERCESDEPLRVSRANIDRILKVSPSEDLVQHEWQKHGTCSGLSQDDFVSSAVAAYSAVTVPSNYKLPDDQIQTTPDDVRDAFLSVNPSLEADDVAATCSRNDLAEVWVCLDKSLRPRACSADVRKRHCGARHVRMRAVRGNWP